MPWIPAEPFPRWLQDMLPAAPAAVLDVAGGHDGARLAAAGYDVVAVAPSPATRTVLRERHEDPAVRWLADSLPDLDVTLRLGLSFDVILLGAVSMQVAPAARTRAFRRLIMLLKPGGLLAVTVRSDPAEPALGFSPVTPDEIRGLVRDHGAFVQRESIGEDHLGRADARWTCLVVRLPDDGTDALPLLRHVILNDNKSSTYKLGLLRTLCRIADGAPGLARPVDDTHVAIPMGLVSLTWLRLYRSLTAADLPQSPRNRAGSEALGFAQDAFRGLPGSPHDLRVGMEIAGDAGATLHRALKDAADTITRMPVRFMTYPDRTGQILTTVPGPRSIRPRAGVRLDDTYLASFGEMHVPLHLWTAVQRFAAWIEPALTAEWIRLMVSYAERQGRTIDRGRIDAAMAWGDPRDVGPARERAARLLAGRRLHCVWSGRRLSADTLDIDHCFPWSVWPCADLWNLLPTHREVNQREKRDLVPAEPLLRAARDRILEWWNSAYRPDAGSPLAVRFSVEAAASLPGTALAPTDLEACHSALSLQRLRIRRNQQAPEWSGGRYLK